MWSSTETFAPQKYSIKTFGGFESCHVIGQTQETAARKGNSQHMGKLADTHMTTCKEITAKWNVTYFTTCLYN